jgi:hypothetical protein
MARRGARHKNFQFPTSAWGTFYDLSGNVVRCGHSLNGELDCHPGGIHPTLPLPDCMI